MFSIRNIFITGVISMATSPLFASEMLRGDVAVNITSDTAANAKNIAFDEARRQVLTDVLRQYADVSSLKDLMKTVHSSEISGLVSSSSIADEQTSNTTYSAKITIEFNEGAVRTWLSKNEIQNWLPDTEHQDVFLAVIELSNKIPQWTEINAIARAEKIALQPQKITGNNIELVLPVDRRGAFTIALRERGWKYTDQDGKLRIWK